jgi:hypothetical protein
MNVGDKLDKNEILNALKTWQETGNLPEDEIVSHVVKACSEVRLFAVCRFNDLKFIAALDDSSRFPC